MTYEQLVDKMGALLDTLEEFYTNLAANRDAISDGLINEMLVEPKTIWQIILNNLQDIVDVHRREDA